MTVMVKLPEFAAKIEDILRYDHDVSIGVAGFTGAGKSCFSHQLLKAYYTNQNKVYSLNDMTWSRKELLRWINGEKNDKGEIVGQKKEYSGFMVDELFSLFYKRNWGDDAQKEAIATLNMCRDRHLFLIGNVPLFWDLDGGFLSRMRFYIYITKRGTAWIFEQENDPFSSDRWNIRTNSKIFRKHGNPYSSRNFLGEITFPDWTPKEKAAYYRIRNKKRHLAAKEIRSSRLERYGTIKQQRDELIRICFNQNPKLTLKDIADVIGISKEAVRLIKEGLR